MHIKRIITSIIESELLAKRSKIILLIGQRQIGKTYELKGFQNRYSNSLYFDFEDMSIQNLFKPAVSELESIIGDKNGERLVLLDEIQYLNKSGSVLKLLHDHFPRTKIIATGSASYLLLRNIGDSLFGRHISFNLYPLTLREILKDSLNRGFHIGGYDKQIHKPSIDGHLPHLLIYGSLPDIFLEDNKVRKENILKSYINSLLFKDILEIEGIRMPQVLKRLLKLLALQTGSEVNPNELAGQLEINRRTVVEYIGLFEKFRIIYTLSAFNNNLRREIKKGFKIYFYDLGIRNALINNFARLDGRNDTGALFENLVVNIIMQNINYYGKPYQLYFWRTFTNAEVDLVLANNETNGLIPMEIKYSKTAYPSKSFTDRYKERIEGEYCVNKDNLWKFI